MRVSSVVAGVTTSYSLAYDPLGRLLDYGKSTASTRTRFLYDGGNITTEMSQTGAITQRYVWGADDDEPLVWYSGADTATRRWLYADERGSVVMGASDTGTKTGLVSYDEYGLPDMIPAGQTGTANTYAKLRFTYTGQAWLPELGLNYYKARMYSPTLGRFLQTDPIGYADGPNWYNYVGSDPVNATDPSGLTTGSNIDSGSALCVGCSGYSVYFVDQNAPVERLRREILGADKNHDGGIDPTELGNAPPSVRDFVNDFHSGDIIVNAFRSSDATGGRLNPNLGVGLGGLGRENGDAQDIIVEARYLRRAVIKALGQICGGCSFDSNNFVAISPNFVGVVDRSKLPKVFKGSLSSHAKASSAAIPGSGYELKLYVGDTDNGGRSTITITTPLTDWRHYIDFVFYLQGDPINSYYARQYCSGVGGC